LLLILLLPNCLSTDFGVRGEAERILTLRPVLRYVYAHQTPEIPEIIIFNRRYFNYYGFVLVCRVRRHRTRKNRLSSIYKQRVSMSERHSICIGTVNVFTVIKSTILHREEGWMGLSRFESLKWPNLTKMSDGLFGVYDYWSCCCNNNIILSGSGLVKKATGCYII